MAKAAIRDKALEIGFDAVGFAPPELGADAQAGLAGFLFKGHHGDMGWLEAKADRRAAPTTLWPEARSVVVLACNYGPDENPLDRLEALRRDARGNISVYAQGRDYHDVIKKRLKVLARWMAETLDCQVKVFVDTAPVMEKPLAELAGLGWQGKHTNLVSTEFGSWLFLGEVYTDLTLEPDEPGDDRCGTCTNCLDICPTDAFAGPYRLDARRCISYLTIEHEGHIDREFRAAIGTRIYGCDDCLAVCPWNKFAAPTREDAFRPKEALAAPALTELAELDDPAFRRMFSKTAIKRTGRDRLIRNVMIAIGNTGNASLVPVAERALDDASPLVRAMAVWALGRLLDAAQFASLAARYSSVEMDPDVREEWQSYAGPARAARSA
jgi:epoxyqueuosine reductase